MRRGACVIRRYPRRIWPPQTAAEFRLTQKGLLMIPIKQEADGERGARLHTLTGEISASEGEMTHASG